MGFPGSRLLACVAAFLGLVAWRESAQLRVHLARLSSGAAFDPPDAAPRRLAPPSEVFPYLDELAHFLSHIPKTGAEYAARELDHLLQATARLPGNRTLHHVRDAQKRFNATAYAGDFFAKNINVNLNKTGYASLAGLTGDPRSDAYTPPMVCNYATSPLGQLHQYQMRVRLGVRFRCALHVTEQPWHAAARHAYTIVQEPLSHVLSQYFHCAESPQHRKSGDMPPLDAWLETYAELTDSNPDRKANRQRDAMRLKKRFHCYNPIDSESEFAAFNHRLPDGYTYPYPNDGERDEGTRLLDEQLFDDLKQKYDVIGDTSQMVKTVCAIFIGFAGHVPEVCDCTRRGDDDGDGRANASATFCLPNLYTHPDPASWGRAQPCPVHIGYDSARHSHGVRHHGAAFLENVTRHQRELLVRLRGRDLVLYNVSRAVFAAQVAALEGRHGVRLCARWRRPAGALAEAPDGGRLKGKSGHRARPRGENAEAGARAEALAGGQRKGKRGHRTLGL